MPDRLGELGVRAAQTSLFVLETIAFAEEPLGVTQIAARIGLSKGAVFRHLQGLVERGYVDQDDVTARYRLGTRTALVGRFAVAGNELMAAAARPMREVRDQTSITTVLTAPTAAGALVLSTVIGSRLVEIGVRPGGILTFHGSAQGKVMLAFGGPALMKRCLAHGLTTLTSYTITDPGAIKDEVLKVAAQGYAIAPEESVLGINVVAAPVFGARDELAAAVALVGSIHFLPRQPEPALIAAVKDMAREVSRNLTRAPAGWGRA